MKEGSKLRACIYLVPPISWVNRAYHFFRQDEDSWAAIERNLMTTCGTLVLNMIILIATIIARSTA